MTIYSILSIHRCDTNLECAGLMTIEYGLKAESMLLMLIAQVAHKLYKLSLNSHYCCVENFTIDGVEKKVVTAQNMWSLMKGKVLQIVNQLKISPFRKLSGWNTARYCDSV